MRVHIGDFIGLLCAPTVSQYISHSASILQEMVSEDQKGAPDSYQLIDKRFFHRKYKNLTEIMNESKALVDSFQHSFNRVSFNCNSFN